VKIPELKVCAAAIVTVIEGDGAKKR
jgi:hypothetical protein